MRDRNALAREAVLELQTAVKHCLKAIHIRIGREAAIDMLLSFRKGIISCYSDQRQAEHN